MVKKTLVVDVEPIMLEWSIRTSGWNKDDLLKKLKINQHIYDSWCNGKVKPSLRQLEDLSKLVKRPLAVFLLSAPPLENPLPKDYRMLPGKEGKFDKKTILAIRIARRLQKISKELSENIGVNINKNLPIITLSDDPKQKGKEYRNEFELTEESQIKFKNSYELFNFLRDIIENRNILVFQIAMPVEDARGFTLVDDSPAIIVINSSDSIEARIFTLIHEFGHVLLNKSGVSIPENVFLKEDTEEVENWCNDFASSLLLPDTLAKKLFESYRDTILGTKTLNKLSKKYKLSKAMLLYNMFKLNYISINQYNSVLERYQPENLKPIAKTKKRGGPPAEKRCLSEKGQKFVSLIANNLDKGIITHSDALDYLSIKAKDLDKVLSTAKK